MKTCRNIVAFLFLSLFATFITSCETNDANEETTELEFLGADEDAVDRQVGNPTEDD